MNSQTSRFVFSFILFHCAAVCCQPHFEVAWRAQSEAGFSGPNELRDSQTGKTIGIVVCEVGHGLVCFSAQGQRLWDLPMTSPVTSGPAIGDVNKDGREEIAAADGGGLLYLIDDQGSVLWTARTHDTVQEESVPAMGDLDGDGLLEIVVGDRSGGVNCFDQGGKRLWTFVGQGDQMGLPLIRDLYDRPGCEIFITSHNGHIYALGADGSWLWQIFHEKECMPGSLPVLADVEGDGKPELYIGGGLHHFLRINPEVPSMVLDENVYLHINTSILATDLDVDGKDDVVFGVKGGKAFCYRGGGFAWTREFHNTVFCSSPLALNLDNDPPLEIIFSNHGTKVLDSDGSVLNEINSPPFNSQPLAGDFDRDGLLDVILCGHGLDGDSGLVFQKWNVPYQEDMRQWITVGGDRTHTRRDPHFNSMSRLPSPRLTTGTSQYSLTPVQDFRLSQGWNEWRFDVSNPEEKRLVLLSEIAFPHGSCERFSNHVYSSRERVSINFYISEAGVYQVTTTLIDSTNLSVLSSSRVNLKYGGPSDDLQYIQDILSRAGQGIESLTENNSHIPAHFKSRVQSLFGRMLAIKSSLKKESQASELPGLIEEAQRVDTLVSSAQRMAPSAAFTVWDYCPWAYFDPVMTLPDVKDPALKVNVSLCKEEYESQALNVTNFSGRSLDVRVWVEDFKGTTTFKSTDHLEFHRAVMVPTLRGEIVADALPLLDQAGILSVPAYETQQLWLTFHAKGLSPGKYTSTLHLKPVDPNPDHITIPVIMEVYDLSLPHPSPLKFCVWAYASKEPDYILRDLTDHGVNVHFAPAPTGVCNEQGEIVGSLDFTAHDMAVTRLSPYGIIMFIGPQSSLTGQPMFSQPWNKAFVAYLRTWIAHLKELGIGYKDFALYPYDEPSSPFSQTSINLVKVAKLIREADPNILVYTDPTSGTNKDSLQMWEGLIDIWCPSAELLERFGDEILPFAKRNGKETWFYDASGRSRTLSCLGIYRWRFWYAWNLGLTGAGWWTYTHGDYLWDGPNPEGDYFYHVYDAPGAVVTSKRWEAAREGIEDYEILFLLKESIKEAEEHGKEKESIDEAKTLLFEIPRSMEKSLHAAGRRLPLDMNSVPQYDAITRMLQDSRKCMIDTCLKLKSAETK